jgi:hypothetical protein
VNNVVFSIVSVPILTAEIDHRANPRPVKTGVPRSCSVTGVDSSSPSGYKKHMKPPAEYVFCVPSSCNCFKSISSVPEALSPHPSSQSELDIFPLNFPKTLSYTLCSFSGCPSLADCSSIVECPPFASCRDCLLRLGGVLPGTSEQANCEKIITPNTRNGIGLGFINPPRLPGRQ